MSEAFELGDEAAGGAFGVAAGGGGAAGVAGEGAGCGGGAAGAEGGGGVVVAAGFAVELAGCEHVPAGAEDRVLDGAERAAVAAAGSQPLVPGGEVDVVGTGRGQGRPGGRGGEPLGAA